MFWKRRPDVLWRHASGGSQSLKSVLIALTPVSMRPVILLTYQVRAAVLEKSMTASSVFYPDVPGGYLNKPGPLLPPESFSNARQLPALLSRKSKLCFRLGVKLYCHRDV
jgi:hypothetical protein